MAEEGRRIIEGVRVERWVKKAPRLEVVSLYARYQRNSFDWSGGREE